MPFASYPSLQDRVVLVTGGATGIGAATVRAFCGQGARVAFVDILEDAADDLVDETAIAGNPPLFVACDLTDTLALREAVDRVVDELGPVRVLVNNAARDDRVDIDTVSEEEWDDSMAVNLRHQFFAAQAVRPGMRDAGGGSIINFSSITWMGGAPALSVYAAAKAGVIGLTNSLARAYGDDNIRVNAIAPGAVVTERQLRLWYTQEQADEMAGRQMLKRRLLPEHLARAVLFLAADDSNMITKQCLVVDAGMR